MPPSVNLPDSLDHHRLASGWQGCTPEPPSSSEHSPHPDQDTRDSPYVAHLPVDPERSPAVNHEGFRGTSKADLHTSGTSRPLQPPRSFTLVPCATQP